MNTACDTLKYKSNTNHANIQEAKTTFAKGKTQLWRSTIWKNEVSS